MAERAPYGADLPRPHTPGPWRWSVGQYIVASGSRVRVLSVEYDQPCHDDDAAGLAALPDYVAALDAACAEVLALRRERDSLRGDLRAIQQVVGATRCSTLDEAQRCLDGVYEYIAEALAALPAPTEEAGDEA